ncbi:hypothetical protein ColLi_10960 [Colletotrichum liriopes]|uniref:Uncharacterized protein n=1 Tax=Colletotrichum liriopes TaxID=708192 RepID=A0AA37LXC9_9PEZI|nr:hypothetical protein ColLi_10960 [Colletotrichum liriopes]
MALPLPGYHCQGRAERVRSGMYPRRWRRMAVRRVPKRTVPISGSPMQPVLRWLDAGSRALATAQEGNAQTTQDASLDPTSLRTRQRSQLYAYVVVSLRLLTPAAF